MYINHAEQQTDFYSTEALPSIRTSCTLQQLKLTHLVKKFHIHQDYHAQVQLLWFKQAVC
jgi:hypothetical protein